MKTPKDFGITNFTYWKSHNHYDFHGHVDLSGKNLTELPFRIGIVRGNFNVKNNKLKSMKNMPYVITGDFDCSYNQIKSLEGGPGQVYGYYDCSSNKLSNLKGFPEYQLYGSFYCSHNRITTLKDIPEFSNGINERGEFEGYVSPETSPKLKGPWPKSKVLNGEFYCDFNNLNSLEGIFTEVLGNLSVRHNKLGNLSFFPKVKNGIDISGNKLKSLEKLPNKVYDFLNIAKNQLVNLENCPDEIDGNFFFFDNKIESMNYYPKKITGKIMPCTKFLNILDLIKLAESDDFSWKYIMIVDNPDKETTILNLKNKQKLLNLISS